MKTRRSLTRLALVLEPDFHFPVIPVHRPAEMGPTAEHKTVIVKQAYFVSVGSTTFQVRITTINGDRFFKLILCGRLVI